MMLRSLGCLLLMVLGSSSLLAGQSAAPANSAPPRFDMQVFLDSNKMDLPSVVPGQLDFQYWQAMVSTAVAMHFKNSGEGHVPTVARQYGDVHLHLIEGQLDVEFADQTLQMKTGDVASWGNLAHRIVCQTAACRLVLYATPVLWTELGPDDGNPVPLYVDPAYYAAHGRKQ